MNYQAHSEQLYTALPTPKWKRSPLPVDVFDWPVAPNATKVSGQSAKVSVSPLQEIFTNPSYADYQPYLTYEGTHQKSLGPKFTAFVGAYGQDAHLILSKDRGPVVPQLKIAYDFNHTKYSHITEQLIIAETGAKLELILDYSSLNDAEIRHFGKTTVVSKPGASVKVIKIQRLSQLSANFDMNLSIVEEGGSVEMVDLQLGSAYKAISNESELVGRHAHSEMKAAYYGEGAEQLDLSYTMTHGAPQTESVILAKGALADEASKVFRGNLFFSTGASESVGKEQEFLTMLSPKVKSDSFPALMCSEDDVVGEHAASIGQIDPEKLFYLMSRGLSQSEAKRLLVKAAFEEIIGEIKERELYEIVLGELDRRIG